MFPGSHAIPIFLFLRLFLELTSALFCEQEQTWRHTVMLSYYSIYWLGLIIDIMASITKSPWASSRYRELHKFHLCVTVSQRHQWARYTCHTFSSAYTCTRVETHFVSYMMTTWQKSFLSSGGQGHDVRLVLIAYDLNVPCWLKWSDFKKLFM